MKSIYVALFLIWQLTFVFGQRPLVAFVSEQETSVKISYCVVTSLKSGETFLTNEEGVFKIPFVISDDTLVFSKIGFSVKLLPVSTIKDSAVVMLEEEQFLASDTDEVNEEQKEKLKTAIEKLRKKQLFQSRAYFYYETQDVLGNTEMTGLYFNTTVQGTKVLKLEYKNGRTAIIEKSLTAVAPNRFLASTPDIWHSIAMIIHSPLHRSKRMPSNPLLSYVEKSLDSLWHFTPGIQNSENTLHLEFEPAVSDSTGHFYGEIWICNKTWTVKQLKLQIDRTNLNPFLNAQWPEDVDMDLVYRFSDVEKNMGNLTFTNFSYSYRYPMTNKTQVKQNHFKNNGIIHYYDYNRPFYTNNENTSKELYFRILSTPYDSTFWKCENVIPMTLSQLNKVRHIWLKAFQSNYYPPDKKDSENMLLAIKGVLVWNKDNYLDQVTNILSDTLISKPSISIYFDVNKYADTILYTTLTTLDIENSKYNLPRTKENLAYQNILFDLAEIIRVNLDEKLKMLRDVTAMKNAYKVAEKDLQSLITRYNKETKLGQDMDVLKEWNDRVYELTGIDSFQIFDIKYKPKKKKGKKAK
ncbi:MAG: hypothetical protein IPK35_03195 [Saprospiraceae bacterium]|jgi:hypothetical protein|nr:hypothetical protein [Saprospiraceae bacterium]